MHKFFAGFPLSLIALAFFFALAQTWIQFPGIVMADWIPSALGRAIGWALIFFGMYKLFYSSNADKLELERIGKASRVAWITLFVQVAVTIFAF